MMERHPAFWTHDDEAEEDAGHLYYFAPTNRRPSPYLKQIHVGAIIDIADDGTLAGVELIDDMPPPPVAALTLPAAEDVAGLVERLEKLVIMDEVGSDNPLARDAATALISLSAERDEARAENTRRRLGASLRAEEAEAAEARLKEVEAERDEALRERDGLLSVKANAREYAKLLVRLRDRFILIRDDLEDDGDRVYFGSTNDADDFRSIVQKTDDWNWEFIIAKSVDGPDIYRTAQVNIQRAEAAEAALAELREKAREVITDLVDEAEPRIEDYYKDTKVYPGEQRRYERDIAPVRAGRAFLAEIEKELPHA